MPSHEPLSSVRRSNRPRFVGVAALALLILVGGAAGAATEGDGSDLDEPNAAQESQDELLRDGSAVYSLVCASCHQAGGVGIEGQFPPLIDNPNVDDAAYLEDVITNGRQGEIELDGVVYNAIMPSFSTLSDHDTTAVVAFIQSGLSAPATAAAVPPLGQTTGRDVPKLAIVTLVLLAGLAAIMLAPRITREFDRLDLPWVDAWLKTAVIVSGVIMLTVVIPDWAIRHDSVSGLSRFAQDLVGVSVWMIGIVIVIWSLWYAHRRSRV